MDVFVNLREVCILMGLDLLVLCHERGVKYDMILPLVLEFVTSIPLLQRCRANPRYRKA
jgi:hypothetical protein